MHNQRHSRAFNPILITTEVETVQDFCNALAGLIYPADRPAPTNLDGLADMLKETHVRKVITSHWSLDQEESAKVGQVFKDLGVTLVH